MQFDVQQAITILERTPLVVETLLLGLDSKWIMSNEGADTWSPFDIIGHYIHGEKTDWVPRMNIILGNGDKHFEPFDRFAQYRDSKGKTIEQLLNEFKQLRKENINTLKDAGITEEKLNLTGIHPKFGTVTLRQLLSTWVTHDLNHINQVARVMAKQYKEEVGPWTEYIAILQ